MVILGSTRGTLGWRNWFMRFYVRRVTRSYHALDESWTPLNSNLVQAGKKCNDAHGKV